MERLRSAVLTLGEGPSDAGASALRSLTWILLLHLTSEQWFHARSAAWDRWEFRTITIGITLALVVHIWVRRRDVILGAVTALMLWYVVLRFPRTGNHHYLEFLLAAVLATFPTDEEPDARFALGTIRWLIILVFLGSGLQKVFHGLYFRGDFLAYQIGLSSSFAQVFQWVLPSSEMQRIASLGFHEGAGPFASPDLRLKVISNLTYLGEAGSALLLLFPRTRQLGLVLLLIVVMAIEVAAREVYFGLLFVFGSLLFLKRDVLRPMLAGVAVVYLLLVVLGSGAFGEVTIH